MIVVDTNIIIPFFLETPLSGTVRQLAKLEPDWAVPRLWQHEFLNVLALNERRGLVTMEECTAIWMNAREVVEPIEHDVNMIEALHFAAQGRISAYDAEYIALAHCLGTLCITLDKELLRKFPQKTKHLKRHIDDSLTGRNTVRESRAVYKAGKKKRKA